MKHAIVVALLIVLLQCRTIESFAVVPFGRVGPHSRQSGSANLKPLSGRINRSRRISLTRLQESLWERLGIEEDQEPQWYVLNCVAGLEMDLLRQCRGACGDMPDVLKFVVPTIRKTRSHGTNRIVTEEKVKYQGYVFAKLRLCPDVYEAIRSLSFCRSWMGPVNQKGYRKLPPAPVALNEEEIEKFGLEEVEFEEETVKDESDSDVILDSEDDEEDKEKRIDEEALKVYLGLRVDDMVKITAKGKFYNEDGIIRRLKDGKIMVRFYTYGSTYDEWLDPGDVRKLSNVEIIKGLSGPSQPITQDDFDGGGTNEYRERGALRKNLMSNVDGATGPRNRRQDRVERGDRYNRADSFDQPSDQRRREEQNWKSYQDRQRQPRTDGGRPDSRWNSSDRRSDERWSNNDRQPNDRWNDNNRRPNDRWNDNDRRPNNRYDSALSDENSQWGRVPPSQQRDRRNDRRPNNNNGNNYQDNRQVKNAIDGKNDWGASVSPATRRAPANADEDAFFASLMSDLSETVNSGKGADKPERRKSNTEDRSKSEFGDDFFTSLMSELSTDSGNSKPGSKSRDDQDSVDDFFAALEAELGSAFDTPQVASSKPSNQATGSADGGDDADDFFARLEAEMSTPVSSQKVQQEEPAEKFQESPAPSIDLSNKSDKGREDLAVAAKEKSSPPKRRKSKSVQAEDDTVPPKKVSVDREESTSPSSSSSKPSPVDFEKCTVPVLKEMLRERGLKLTGKKSELIERLTQ